MCIDDRNYFELCNDILGELYYDEVETFDELDDIPEGKRTKRLINQALSTICNNEQIPWKFRVRNDAIQLVENIREYDRPNGYIQFLKYPHKNLVLSYLENHQIYPTYTRGTPIYYWMEDGKILFYPVPKKTGDIIHIQYLTYDFAYDSCKVGKPKMENEEDTPIIPNNHRDILVWKVCTDWRANAGDAKSAYYNNKYKEAYRAMLEDQTLTEDYPRGLHIIPSYPYSYKQAMLDILGNPYTVDKSREI